MDINQWCSFKKGDHLKLRAIVVGLGNIGLAYGLGSRGASPLSHIGSLLRHPDFELVCGIDPDHSAREKLTRISEVKAYSSLSEFPKNHPLDLVIISTPTHTHPEVIAEAFSLRPKCILLEKPAGLTFQDAKAMNLRANHFGVPVFVNYMRNSDTEILRFFEFAKRSLDLSRISGSYAFTGNLLNSASHGLQLLRSLLGPIDGGFLVGSVSRSGQPLAGLLQFQAGSISLTSIPEFGYDHHHLFFWTQEGRVSITGHLNRVEFSECQDDHLYNGESLIGPTSRQWTCDESEYQMNVLTQISRQMKGLHADLVSLEDVVMMHHELSRLSFVAIKGDK